MTVKEKYAKYSTEHLTKIVESLRIKFEEAFKLQEQFKAERNLEFYRIAEKDCSEAQYVYLEAQCALEGRMK